MQMHSVDTKAGTPILPALTDIGTIFGSVAARGKLQGDDMLQLMSSGVPVLQLLAKQTGKTSAEVSDMVSKGKIDFATFEAAMRQGMGGAALKSGETFSGAVANMQAALGRLGLDGVTNVRQGKQFVIDLDDDLDADRLALLERLSGELLSNPVIEDFRLSVDEDA